MWWWVTLHGIKTTIFAGVTISFSVKHFIDVKLMKKNPIVILKPNFTRVKLQDHRTFRGSNSKSRTRNLNGGAQTLNFTSISGVHASAGVCGCGLPRLAIIGYRGLLLWVAGDCDEKITGLQRNVWPTIAMFGCIFMYSFVRTSCMDFATRVTC